MSDKPDSPFPPAPGGRPLFLDPEKAAAALYVGEEHTLPPNFDHELDEPPAPKVQPAKPGDVIAVRPIENATHMRWREVARLHALGKPNIEIAEMLNYSPMRVSQVLQIPQVINEVERYRTRLYDNDVVNAIKDIGGDAVKLIGDFIRDPREKKKDRAEAAKWVAEKITGKPKQEVNLESNTLAAFMELAKDMKARGESLDVIDVTPNPAAEGGMADQKPSQLTESKFVKVAQDLF